MAPPTFDQISQRLHTLYSKIPKTKGCLEHIDKPREDGGCGGWCCQIQSPSILTVEFLLTWRWVISNCDVPKIIDLIEASLRNYLSSMITKGCVFWDKESKLCAQHGTRPLACRQYGITPKEEFDQRLVRLRVLYQDRADAIFKDQCDLVSTEDGSEVTTERTGAWWDELSKIEEDAGVEKDRINDEPGGTYRTYPEHILSKVFSAQMVESLQILRVHGEDAEKQIAIREYMRHVRDELGQLENGTAKNKDN